MYTHTAAAATTSKPKQAMGRAQNVALGVGIITTLPIFLSLLAQLYRKHHLLTSLPGPKAGTLSMKGHEEELEKVCCFECMYVCVSVCVCVCRGGEKKKSKAGLDKTTYVCVCVSGFYYYLSDTPH